MGPLCPTAFFPPKTISKAAVIKTKSATIAFFLFSSFLPPGSFFFPFFFLRYCDFGAYRAQGTCLLTPFPWLKESQCLLREIRHNGGRQSTFAGNSALLPSDVMDFAILPAMRFWRETVWLIDVMWPWSYQWEWALMGKIGDLKIQRRDCNENVAFKRL